MPGRPRPFRASAALVAGSAPPGLGLWGSVEHGSDIDVAMSASAARLRLAREAAGIGHWDWDIEEDRLTLSREASSMLGLRVGASIAELRKAWPRLCHPDDLEAIAALRRQALSGRSPVLAELRIRRSGEDYRNLLIRGHADAGSRHRLLGELIDITDHRRAQAEAKAAQEMFRRVTEAAPGLLYVLDLETGESEHLNHGYRTFAPNAPARGREATLALWDLVHPEDLPALQRHRRACFALQDGAVAEITLRLRLPDGSLRWVHSQRRAIARGADGRVTRLVCSAQDVTALRESAETLRQLTRRLLTAQDDERRRIARDLHDSTAQNLLGAALALHSARDRLGVSPDLDEALELVEASQREIRTLSYLLYPPLLDEMGLPAALTWYAEGFTRRTGLPVRLDLPDRGARAGRLPLSREVETAMFRVAQEALTNAWRHAAPTSASVELRVAGAGGRRRIRLRIADDGRGMETRRDGASQPIGLGLAGMEQRMQAVGGWLSIESSPGAGTVIEASGPADAGLRKAVSAAP